MVNGFVFLIKNSREMMIIVSGFLKGIFFPVFIIRGYL